MTSERERLVDRRDLVRRDLRELEEQETAGELDPATAERLRRTYRAELHSLESTIESLPAEVAVQPDEPDGVSAQPPPARRSPRRMVVGAVVMIAALSIAIALAARDTGGPASQASPDSPGALTVDPASVTNEELEAVVAANPGINGMRMALADRYFEAEQFGDALDHYLTIAENDPTPIEKGKALTRIGWIAYRTGMGEAAESYVLAGLDADPTNVEAKLYIGFITFYGLGDAEGAVPLLEAALEIPNLSANVIGQIHDALAEARGEVTP